MKKRQFFQTLSLLILCFSFCCTVLFGAKQSRMWGIISCREMTFMERREKKEKTAKEKKPSPKGGLVVSDSGNRVFRFEGLETECVGRKALELPRRVSVCVCVRPSAGSCCGRARLGRLRCSAPGKRQAAKVPWQGPGMGPQEQKSLFVLTLPAETGLPPLLHARIGSAPLCCAYRVIRRLRLAAKPQIRARVMKRDSSLETY